MVILEHTGMVVWQNDSRLISHNGSCITVRWGIKCSEPSH